jgi:hypothetical protein
MTGVEAKWGGVEERKMNVARGVCVAEREATEMKYHHHTYTAMKNENTRNFICNTQEEFWCSTSCIM